MKLYRAMRAAADGRPELGRSARGLGVRTADRTPHNDVAAADPADLVVPGVGGLSVAPDDPVHLPRNRRPAGLGGFGKDPVWEIDDADLGPGLLFRRDSPSHGLVGASQVMALADYEQFLAATRDKWRRVIG